MDAEDAVSIDADVDLTAADADITAALGFFVVLAASLPLVPAVLIGVSAVFGKY